MRRTDRQIRRALMGLGLGLTLGLGPVVASPSLAADKALTAAIAGPWRSEESRARDVYRHPEAALSFWGLKAGLTIVELEPGNKGWWVEILAPYAKATGGQYIAALPDRTEPGIAENVLAARTKAHADFTAEIADKGVYGNARAVDFGPKKLDSLAPQSADMVLVARSFHNWARSGRTEPYLKAIATILKPGGVLAVEQHRIPAGSEQKPDTGYVTEAYVIEAATKAGLVLEARSQINANPKDAHNHPFGVWTLKPIRSSSDTSRTLSPDERARYDAIGESDRMTLRFRKPG
jgi:predicted methyltransferase